MQETSLPTLIKYGLVVQEEKLLKSTVNDTGHMDYEYQVITKANSKHFALKWAKKTIPLLNLPSKKILKSNISKQISLGMKQLMTLDFTWSTW